MKPLDRARVSELFSALGYWGMAHDQDLADRVHRCLRDQEGLREKRMFGGLAFLINGHMACAASSIGGLMLRVHPADAEELISRPHAEPFRMRGREMKGWLHVDTDGLQDDSELAGWIKIGVDYVRDLPPKP